MIDREKVIKGLECCKVQNGLNYPNCEECPYADDEGSCLAMDELLSDAYDLLKSYAEADLIDRQSLWEHMNNLLQEPGASMMIWSKDVLAVIEEEEQWH